MQKGLILCREQWALDVNVSGNLCRKDRFLSSTAAAKPQEHQNLHRKLQKKTRKTPQNYKTKRRQMEIHNLP